MSDLLFTLNESQRQAVTHGEGPLMIVAGAYGAVGLPARASGVARDVRLHHPYAVYPEVEWKMVTAGRMKDGRIDHCFPRDPSFCNWPLFGEIGPGNIVPDFPLCNKSLNLSYSGTDM